MSSGIGVTDAHSDQAAVKEGRGKDLRRLGLLIVVVQLLFWGLFYAPWLPGPSQADIDRVAFDRVELAELAAPTPAAADAASYRAIELPYTDCCDPAYLAMRASFTLTDIPAEGLGLVAFQQVDNFIIRANGSIVHQLGTMEFGRQSFHGQRPYLIRIPAGMLKTGSNDLSFITVRHGFPYTDLVPPLLGAYEQVRAATAMRFWQTIDYRLLGGWLTFILGFFALVLSFRSQDRRFAAWLMTLCWAWTAFAAYGLYFDLPFGGTGRMIAFYVVNTALAVSLLGFIDAWTRRPMPFLQPALVTLWAAFNGLCALWITAWPMPQGFDLSNDAWAWSSFILGVLTVARLIWHFARAPEARALEAALLSVCAVCLALDGIGERFGLLSGGYLMDSAPLLLLAFIVAFLQRNFTLFQSAVALNTMLERTVQAREAELAEAHGRERELVGRAARSEERRRLMRDMHDGVGGQLVGLLLAVRRGAVDHGRIADGLQEVMDEIRLMIDSVDAAGTSLQTMLGVFETRVRPRVEEAGFRFDWTGTVDGSADLPPQQVLQLFRMMQEAVTNALKHSDGDRISVAVSDETQSDLIIAVTDNGKGLSVAENNGHGLSNMQLRIAAVGGRIAFEDAAPGLRVVAHVPLAQTLREAA